MLKHNCKRLPMLKNTIKRLLMLKHTSNRLPIKQNYKKNVWHLNTWYTISGAHDTNQIQTLWYFRISKMLTLRRNSKWTFGCWTILTEFWRFLNCCRVLLFFKSSLLYIEVWNMNVELPAHPKRVVWSFDQSPMILFLICLFSYEGEI